jgi:hypothetical protein
MTMHWDCVRPGKSFSTCRRAVYQNLVWRSLHLRLAFELRLVVAIEAVWTTGDVIDMVICSVSVFV